MLTLSMLVANFQAEHNLTGDQLERRSGGRVKSPRWGQIAKGQRLKAFPDPETLTAIADVIGVDVNTVVLATAQQVGVPVRWPHYIPIIDEMPAGVADLPSGVQRGVLAMVRALVRQNAEDLPRRPDDRPTVTPEWKQKARERMDADLREFGAKLNKLNPGNVEDSDHDQ